MSWMNQKGFDYNRYYNDIVFSYFLSNPYKKLKVNDKEYECVVGNETEGGFYKNGYIAKCFGNPNAVYTKIGRKPCYIKIQFYTSVNNKIDIEETVVIRNDDFICKRNGWNNVDLLCLDKRENHYKELKDYITKLQKEV